jgi:hypothetical protein
MLVSVVASSGGAGSCVPMDSFCFKAATSRESHDCSGLPFGEDWSFGNAVAPAVTLLFQNTSTCDGERGPRGSTSDRPDRSLNRIS